MKKDYNKILKEKVAEELIKLDKEKKRKEKEYKKLKRREALKEKRRLEDTIQYVEDFILPKIAVALAEKHNRIPLCQEKECKFNVETLNEAFKKMCLKVKAHTQRTSYDYLQREDGFSYPDRYDIMLDILS
jgi:hypothetical protein